MIKIKLMTDEELIEAYGDCTLNIIKEHEQQLEEHGEIDTFPHDEVGMSREGIQYMYNLFTHDHKRDVKVHGTYDDFENVMFTILTPEGIRWLLTAWHNAMKMN